MQELSPLSSGPDTAPVTAPVTAGPVARRFPVSTYESLAPLRESATWTRVRGGEIIILHSVGNPPKAWALLPPVFAPYFSGEEIQASYKDIFFRKLYARKINAFHIVIGDILSAVVVREESIAKGLPRIFAEAEISPDASEGNALRIKQSEALRGLIQAAWDLARLMPDSLVQINTTDGKVEVHVNGAPVAEPAP